jgi:hypothetical protein
MKKVFTVAILFSAIIGWTSNAYAQFSMSITPSINIVPGLYVNTGYAGYRIKNFEPYIGFMFFKGDYTYTEKGMRYNYDLNMLENYSDEYKFTGTFYIPHLGLKTFLFNKKDISTYVNFSFLKPIVTFQYKENGVVPDNVEALQKNSKYGMWGTVGGFGAEYYFSKQFSIGGELGIRWFFATAQQTKKDVEIYIPNNNNYLLTDRTYDIKMNYGFMYALFSFNFYIGESNSSDKKADAEKPKE